MKKKIICAILVTALAVTSFTGCGKAQVSVLLCFIGIFVQNIETENAVKSRQIFCKMI